MISDRSGSRPFTGAEAIMLVVMAFSCGVGAAFCICRIGDVLSSATKPAAKRQVVVEKIHEARVATSEPRANQAAR